MHFHQHRQTRSRRPVLRSRRRTQQLGDSNSGCAAGRRLTPQVGRKFPQTGGVSTLQPAAAIPAEQGVLGGLEGRSLMSPRGWNRTPESCADHLSCATCPAPVFAWIGDGNGQIVAVSVVPLARAGGAAGEVISARLVPFSGDMFEDRELPTAGVRKKLAPGRLRWNR